MQGLCMGFTMSGVCKSDTDTRMHGWIMPIDMGVHTWDIYLHIYMQHDTGVHSELCITVLRCAWMGLCKTTVGCMGRSGNITLVLGWVVQYDPGGCMGGVVCGVGTRLVLGHSGGTG